jgi:hypothetical protein
VFERQVRKPSYDLRENTTARLDEWRRNEVEWWWGRRHRFEQSYNFIFRHLCELRQRITTELFVWWQWIERLACQGCRDSGLDVADLIDEEYSQQGTERGVSVRRRSLDNVVVGAQ